MPLLALRCDRCGTVFEELAHADELHEVSCRACGGEVQRHYQGKSNFTLLKSDGCGPAGYDCSRAGTGCGCGCRH